MIFDFDIELKKFHKGIKEDLIKLGNDILKELGWVK